MNPDDAAWRAYERLADALSDDLLGADAAEVESNHPGRGARVQAAALRQALRCAAADAPSDDGMPRDMLRMLTMRALREHKP